MSESLTKGSSSSQMEVKGSLLIRHSSSSKSSDLSKPFPTNGYSRIYPAKGNIDPLANHPAKNKVSSQSGKRSTPLVPNGSVKESELAEKSSRSSECHGPMKATDDETTQKSGDVSSIIKKFNGPGRPRGHSSSEGHSKVTSGKGSSVGKTRTSAVETQPPNSQNKSQGKFSLNNFKQPSEVPAKRTVSTGNTTQNSIDHLKGHRNGATTNGNLEEDDDLADETSTQASSGYVTDHLSDHSAEQSHHQVVIRAGSNHDRNNDLSIAKLKLHGNNQSSREPVDRVNTATTTTTTTIRTFEDASDEIDADHPYFARLAAEAEEPAAILSRAGSFRGVKNLVRAGIASLLDKSDGKKSVNYRLLEKGKVVLYTTSVTVIRDTLVNCHKIKRILQTQMVEYDERDVFMSKSTQQELTDRLNPDAELPQLFVDGYHLGGADEIDRLNENGTLRRIFSGFKKVQQATCCIQCGGFRFVPCNSCHGSKKSKRNCFTDEFCALRCIKCDDNGLVKCNMCNDNPVVDNDENAGD